MISLPFPFVLYAVWNIVVLFGVDGASLRGAEVNASLLGTCTPCPKLQSFDDPNDGQCRQNCPDQERFQWIKDLIKEGCNQVWELEAKVYYIDRQYLLPCGVQIKGAGRGKTIIRAVRCEEPQPSYYGIGTEGVKYRIGFVMNTNTKISDLSFEGADTRRYARSGAQGKNYASEGYVDGPGDLCHAGGNGFTDLQGGAPFETPGCSEPYECAVTPCINGNFTVPACYKWDPIGNIAVKNVRLENIDTTHTDVGFFGSPLFPEHLGVGVDSGFDPEKYRPSNFTISNFQVKMSFADGINFHGSFDNVLLDRYVVDSSGDDGVALWSYRDSLGKVTVKNSEVHSNGYQGCYVAYGGTGPFTWTNNQCSGSGHTAAKCLWLDGDMFNGQFNANTKVTVENQTCEGRSSSQECVERGHPQHPEPLCPQTCSTVQWGECQPSPWSGTCLSHLQWAMEHEGKSCENATSEVTSQCPACSVCSTDDCPTR